jgi:hypothetical protein
MTLCSLLGINVTEEVFVPFLKGFTKRRCISTELVVITSQQEFNFVFRRRKDFKSHAIFLQTPL